MLDCTKPHKIDTATNKAFHAADKQTGVTKAKKADC